MHRRSVNYVFLEQSRGPDRAFARRARRLSEITLRTCSSHTVRREINYRQLVQLYLPLYHE